MKKEDFKLNKLKRNNRKKNKVENKKVCRELVSGVLMEFCLAGTYGMDEFLDLDDKLVDKM